MKINKELFAKEYAYSGNATQSYIKAGGSSHIDTAKSNAYKLLTDTYIQELVDKHREKREKELEKEFEVSKLNREFIYKEWIKMFTEELKEIEEPKDRLKLKKDLLSDLARWNGLDKQTIKHEGDDLNDYLRACAERRKNKAVSAIAGELHDIPSGEPKDKDKR